MSKDNSTKRYEVGDRLIVAVEKMVYGGKGLARTESGVLFVENVLPGEEVDVRITGRKKDFYEAECVSVLTPSPERVEAPCPWAFRCGGCHYQHTSLENQRRLKMEVFKDTLARVGKIDARLVREMVPSPRTSHYRNTVQFQGNGTQMGFYRRGTNEVVDVQTCLIADHKINSVFHLVRGEPFHTLILRTDGERVVLLGDSHQEIKLDPRRLGLDGLVAASGGETRHVEGDTTLYHCLRDKVFRVSAGSFYQVNSGVLEKLMDHLDVKLADGGGALWDLFGGVGVFGVSFAPRFREVRSFELSLSACRDLEANLELNGVANLENIQWDGELGLEETIPPDVVILDPPRRGITAKLGNDLVKLGPEQILYVSCDPATLARDLKRFVESGCYRLIDVTPFEMFPQTHHLESCAHLIRLSS